LVYGQQKEIREQVMEDNFSVTSNALSIDHRFLNGDARRIFELMDISESTRNDYSARIGEFLRFVSVNGFHRNSFLEYKRHLDKRVDLKISSKNKYLASSRIFLKELARQGIIPDITLNIRSFKANRKHKREGINTDEVKIILSNLEQLSQTNDSIRLKAIIYLLAFQGLRLTEIRRLESEDINLKEGTALIRGKMRHDKEKIYLHPFTVEALREYLKINKINSGALFQSTSNRNRNGRMTIRALQHIVNGYLKSLGIEKVVHGFRHFYCTKIVRGFNGDLAEAIKFTRHRNVQTVMIYYDSVKMESNLPQYYKAFEGLNS
jgi:integrase